MTCGFDERPLHAGSLAIDTHRQSRVLPLVHGLGLVAPEHVLQYLIGFHVSAQSRLGHVAVPVGIQHFDLLVLVH